MIAYRINAQFDQNFLEALDKEKQNLSSANPKLVANFRKIMATFMRVFSLNINLFDSFISRGFCIQK